MSTFFLGLLVAYSIFITLVLLGATSRWYEERQIARRAMRELYGIKRTRYFQVLEGVPNTAKRYRTTSPKKESVEDKEIDLR